MTICPICKSQGTLRRGLPAQGREQRYFAVCLRCRSYVSVPAHEYFQLYSRERSPAGSNSKELASVSA
jgi:hypothetical protein